MNKLNNLQKTLAGYHRVAICFSGGVDSTFLLKVATDQLGAKSVLALLADTPSMPRSEIESTCRIAESMGCGFKVVKTNETNDPVYISNPVDRCYYCKLIIFGTLIDIARELDFEIVLDGNNFDDADDYRPGHKAAVELGVKSPLMDACLTKSDIRELSRMFNLPTADKPSLACLSTRIPAGREITIELLKKIELAEQVLWDAGLSQIRVRDYDDLARIEIAECDFCKMANSELRGKIFSGVKTVGYNQVVLDLKPLCRK